ncbi:MAG: hypothetical protein DSY76_06085 [Bacteroidetes bacterium]|nr:MAG: hypothetical protein DSY76_06085 [Bacteroidota bacterium]
MINKIIASISRVPKHTILLLGIILFVFVFPLFEKGAMKEYLVTLSYTVMLLSVGSIVEFRSKWMFYIIAFAVILQWIALVAEAQGINFIKYISFIFSLIVFSIAIYKMVEQVIKSKIVDAQLIIETIIGYLLIGIIFTLINVLIISIKPGAIGFINDTPTLGDIIYYSYITFTTIGYGDISPVVQIARSTAILFGLIGQLYLTIIIAFIIGKYLNSKN